MLAIFTIEHEQVLRTDLNNSEIRYTKKLCIFLTGGVYTPYAPRLSTPLRSPTALSHLLADSRTSAQPCYSDAEKWEWARWWIAKTQISS